MEPMCDGIIFESAYSSKVYEDKIGPASCPQRVIPNGLTEEEFFESRPDANAADFVFVGELRDLKGVHVLLDALATLNTRSRVSAVIVGMGPDEDRFKEQAKELGLADRIEFPGAMPAHAAFRRGRCLVVPSLAESFPYIVLEAAAARMPLIVSKVGGIPEIIGQTPTAMVAPGDKVQLAARMDAFLQQPHAFVEAADSLQLRVKEHFNIRRMTQDILGFYGAASALRRAAELAA